jgi:hypothetical protein
VSGRQVSCRASECLDTVSEFFQTQLFETRQDLFVDDDEAEVISFRMCFCSFLRASLAAKVAYERSDLEGVDIFDVDVTGNSPFSNACVE